MKRHILSVTSLLMILSLTGCYAQYNYRPAGWSEGWYSGYYNGHRGWYDRQGNWRGWQRNGIWHDERARGWRDPHRHDARRR